MSADLQAWMAKWCGEQTADWGCGELEGHPPCPVTGGRPDCPALKEMPDPVREADGLQRRADYAKGYDTGMREALLKVKGHIEAISEEHGDECYCPWCTDQSRWLLSTVDRLLGGLE